jgi:hypothetical protein
MQFLSPCCTRDQRNRMRLLSRTPFQSYGHLMLSLACRNLQPGFPATSHPIGGSLPVRWAGFLVSLPEALFSKAGRTSYPESCPASRNSESSDVSIWVSKPATNCYGNSPFQRFQYRMLITKQSINVRCQKEERPLRNALQ